MLHNSDIFLTTEDINVSINTSHKNPSITYMTQDEEPHIQIAWTGGFEELITSNNLGTSDGTNYITAISLTLNIHGDVTQNGNTCFKIIPKDDKYEADFTAISGRHANSERDMLMSWTNLSGSKVFYKRFVSDVVAFKTPIITNQESADLELEINIYPNPSKGTSYLKLKNYNTNTKYLLNVSDLSGRSISTIQGTPSILENRFSQISNYLKQGMYFITIIDLSTGTKAGHSKFI